MTMTRDDLFALREGWDFEAKKAAGRDGMGVVPDAFWPTYSAMGNTRGGQVVLGVKERADSRFEVHGIRDTERVERQLWDLLVNSEKVSVNLLAQEHVAVEEIEGKKILVIQIPRALRKQRPVHINGDLWGGTYVRVHEGDRQADRDRIRRMIAEADTDSRDDRVLPEFGLADLDMETLRSYRQVFRDTNPDHPWLALDDTEFLTQLGALGRDRETGNEGLTAAGLLMFGQHIAIRGTYQNYFVDYQERAGDGDAIEWSHRIYPDGRWSGNLYDFYRRVIPRLTADLAVPFKLRPDLYRAGETHVHEALREALVNSLIHADFEGRISIQVLRFPDRFEFRNPGGLRLPVEQIRQGGTSDCRNRSLQQMFLRLGIGEQAGSGFSRILRAWKEQSWRAPHLNDDAELDVTTLRLGMTSLLPPEVLAELEQRLGRRFTDLDEVARLAVATAAIEGQVTNRRMQEVSEKHPRDLTFMFKDLVGQGLLTQHGERSGTWYTLPVEGSPQTAEGSPQTSGRSPQTPPKGSQMGETGPLIEDAETDPIGQVRSTRWVRQEVAREAVLTLCDSEFRTVQQIAEGLGRATKTVQENYLKPMVREGLLELLHPDRPNHPNQAYRRAHQEHQSQSGAQE